MDEEILKLISLKNKVVVISGGGSGIGLAIAKRFSESEAIVIILDINESKGKEAVEEIRGRGGEAVFYRCDVTSNSDCEKTVNNIIKKFGRVDVLVNSAGVIIRKDVIELDEEEWDLVLDVNLKSIYILSHHIIPHMIMNKGGNIINIGSGWGLKGGPKAAAYCAAKGGVVNLTRAMAIDHGRDGIRVNCICPGDVDTPLLRSEAEQLGEDIDKFLGKAADRPINRIGIPEDIANAALYLATDLSSWVTGSILVVDGGGSA